MFAGLRGKCFTPEGFRPLEAMPGQHRLTAGLHGLTERSAGRLRSSLYTLRSVERAQELLQIRGAPHLYKWCKRFYLQVGVGLKRVSEDVGHGGLSVCQVFAERDCDRLT